MSEYQIVHLEGWSRLHHVTCANKETLVLEWSDGATGGMGLDALLHAIEAHKVKDLTGLEPRMQAARIPLSEKKRMIKIIEALYQRFGRPPSEEELVGFIVGDEAKRLEIWNFGLATNPIPYHRQEG